MSQLFINAYLAELDRLKKVSGEAREGIVSEAFKDLLKGWGRQHDLVFVAQYKLDTLTKEKRYVDGALLHELRVPFGYWEAKDEADDLNEEISRKFKRGYPQDNIVFEDSRNAVLIQHRQEVMRCDVTDVAALEKLLKLFFAYEPPAIAGFRTAVEKFKGDLPAVLAALREMIERQHTGNAAFREAAAAFLTHAQEAINPALGEADVREMLIQHILTEEIFAKVFDDSDFHRQNNVARELYRLEDTFFTGGLKKSTLKGLEPYYAAIRAAAAQIGSHHEKQAFLKVIYENFYRVYNPPAAERLGVFYTPNEIVRFMIDGADWLCERHFGKNLVDKDVDILDPATGTGTFICELLEHFRGQPAKLRHKYRDELHANEVAILPYYVANLNIEATYAAITGEYEEFANLCFVDTLDNVGQHTAALGSTGDLFGSMSEENVARIRRQNSRRISVVIGNPPYRANQANENDNNKNREYPEIDGRIKQTYIAESTARKTKLYDMYARFFRWASDRLDANGVLAFVTNRSFVNSRTFDGFRKTVAAEFAEIRVVDLGGDVRSNPKLSGTRHNVFGIQTGVTISFFVKKAGHKDRCRIFYARRPEFEIAEEKLAFLAQSRLATVVSEEVRPKHNSHWLDIGGDEFDDFLPVASKATKAATSARGERALFKLYSLGVSTNRDEWLYASDSDTLKRQIQYLIDRYNRQKPGSAPTTEIKWSRNLKRRHSQNRHEAYSDERLVQASYRPFCKLHFYDSALYVDEAGSKENIFPIGAADDVANLAIMVCSHPQSPFTVHAVAILPDAGYCGRATQMLPLRIFAKGAFHDNITDWSLKQFKIHYKAGPGKRLPEPNKEGIFHYVYAALHDPAYRETYAQNLKLEFPRIPLHGAIRADFWRWAGWGRALMDLHIGYGAVAPWPLARLDTPDENARAAGLAPKCQLKANQAAGRIVVDSETVLSGIPPEAWSYRLGNRSALEWVLDQHKEKKPKDTTIREKFDTYRFADHKERVIDLLARVTRVSVETMTIVTEIAAAPR